MTQAATSVYPSEQFIELLQTGEVDAEAPRTLAIGADMNACTQFFRKFFFQPDDIAIPAYLFFFLWLERSPHQTFRIPHR